LLRYGSPALPPRADDREVLRYIFAAAQDTRQAVEEALCALAESGALIDLANRLSRLSLIVRETFSPTNIVELKHPVPIERRRRVLLC
jgi:hypothetical protein